MPVFLEGRKGSSRNHRRGYCICEQCPAQSKTYQVLHVAEALSICEQVREKEGWSYDIGFWSMLLGHSTLCPACSHVELV